MEIRYCPFCNNQINLDATFEHEACKDFTEFVLEDLINKARKKLEILLLQRKELIIYNKNKQQK